MTIEEKLKMYREKKQFIYEVSRTFIKVPSGHSVEEVSYEVFFKDTEFGPEILEWITVRYKGGGKAHRRVTGNSNSANFREVANMVEGGCYDENTIYWALDKMGWKKLDLYQMYSYKEVK